MAPSAGSLLIDITTNVARLQADMGKVSRIVGSTFSGIKNIMAGVSFAALGREALELGDNLSKASEKLGIGIEKLSALSYAAQLSDVSLEALEKGMKFLSKAIIDANDASSEAAIAFKAMGFNVKDLAKMPLDVVFSKVAEAFFRMEDGAGKVSLAVALFGRAGMDMIPVLNKGAAGIRELEAEARRLGATISDDTGKKLAEANDNLKSFWMAVKGTAASITGELVGALKKLGEAFGQSLAGEAGEGFDTFGPGAKRFKGPALPGKTAAPDPTAIKKALEEAQKVREHYAKLDVDGQVAYAEAIIQANDAEAKALSDINREYWAEKDKEDEKYRQLDLDGWVAYAEAVIAENDATASALAEINKKNTEDSELYKVAWMDATLAVSDAMMSLYGGMQAWISSSLEGLITGTMKVQDVLRNLGKMMLSIITDYIAKWVVSRVFMAAMGKTFQAAEIAAAVVTGTALATAYAPAAAAASLSSFGANSIPAMAGIAATVAFSEALFAIPALAEGGIVTRPTLALIGEKGPEAVVPLDGGRAGGGVTILQIDGQELVRWLHKANRTGMLQLVPA